MTDCRCRVYVALGLFLGCVGGVPAWGDDRNVDFRQDIQPIFQQRCFECHGPDAQEAGLRLDLKNRALDGGDSGPVIQPGDSAGSLLIQYVSGTDPDIVMPPDGERLTDEQIGLLRRWIDQGAVWPDESVKAEDRSTHWSFQPIQRPTVPEFTRNSWIRNPIDAFILARLRDNNVAPSPEADRATLIRRLSLDLLGLPPTPEEVDDFVHDPRPDAYERLVDRLLASPHFGECWGRHWLDLARYADSDGYEKDLPREHAWRWRDWVIEAFNRDLPFDQFTVEQLAGDLLPDATLEQRLATGFHRNTLTNREGGIDKREDRDKQLVDRVNTTGSVWMGLTVGCAQCHSHKYDPITQREYYQLYAFFAQADEIDLPAPTDAELAAYQQTREQHEHRRRQLAAALSEQEQQLPARLAEWESLQAASRPTPSDRSPAAGLDETIAAILKTPAAERTEQQCSELLAWFRTHDAAYLKAKKALEDWEKKAPTPPSSKVMVFTQRETLEPTHVHLKGDFLQPGPEVQPGTPAVLNSFQPDGQPDRLDLARWLVSPEHPLTRRVEANRVWQHLFGVGLVETTEDFGTQGERPSHPELLDWLASEYLERGWSRKAMIRLIVTSATYRQASHVRMELVERDPKNKWLARQNRFRVSAETVRDLSLAASGLLNRELGGKSIRPPLPPGVAELGYANSVKWPESKGADKYRRGCYIFFQRTVPYPMLMTFDSPDSNVTCTRRERSNTPLQALTLLNNQTFFECAQALGGRMVDASADPGQRIREGFRYCLGREPSDSEAETLLQLYRDYEAEARSHPQAAAKLLGKQGRADQAAAVALARVLLNLDEFITRE